jgi:phosphohistidine phosphatase
MKLFVLRHGIAVEPGTAGYEHDSDRPLTPEGVSRMREIARALEVLDVKPDAILTSPYVRAQQTAEIVATALRLKKHLHVCAHLACGGDPNQLIAEINRSHAKADSVMLVGHEPYLSSLAVWLTTGKPGGASLEMKKGGLCVLELEQLRAGRCAMLQWLAPPRLLTRVK